MIAYENNETMKLTETIVTASELVAITVNLVAIHFKLSQSSLKLS